MGIFEGAANAIRKIGKKKSPANGQRPALPEVGTNIRKANGKEVPKLPEGPADNVSISGIRSKTKTSVYRQQYLDEEAINEREELLKKLEQTYDEMKATLTAFGFKETPPSKKQVMDAIAALAPSKLEQIMQFGKPTFLITPPGDFASKVKAMNDHRTMPSQNSTYSSPAPSDQVWGSGSAKMLVTVVDGLDAMPEPSFITNDLSIGEKMEKYEEDFANRKVDMMSCQEGAMLIMQSLNRGQPVDDNNSTETATYFSRKHLPKGSAVPYGYWDSNTHQIYFFRNDPDVKRVSLRCRPSVRVLEI